MFNVYKAPIWDDENILEIDGDGGYSIVNISNPVELSS